LAVLIRAHVDRVSGVVDLRFPYEQRTKEIVKGVPGSKWDPTYRSWRTSLHGLAAMERSGLKIESVITCENRAEIPPSIASHLRPYQIEGAEFLIKNSGALLTMDPRTGKTVVAIAAMMARMGLGQIDAAIICYPASVSGEWLRQLKEWSRLDLEMLQGFSPLDQSEITRLNAKPYLALGCHYEILDKRILEIHSILRNRRFGVIADELHACKNRKAGRTKALASLARAFNNKAELEAKEIPSGNCAARWGLTGTPMRNRPRDLYCLFDFAAPGSMGSYWTFAKKYCTPAETPIWMGDFSFRPISEVQIGDEVIGWVRRDTEESRGNGIVRHYRLARTKVVNVASYPMTSLVKLTMESGRLIRCTPDHQWLSANNFSREYLDSPRDVEIRVEYANGNVRMKDLAEHYGLSIQSIWRIVNYKHNFEYLPPKVGRKIIRVLDSTEQIEQLDPKLDRLVGWVAGMYDGEGHGAFIAQSSNCNPETLERLCIALDELGIEYEPHEDRTTACGGVYITGGRDGFLRFLRIIQPSRQNNGWDRTILTGRFRKPDRIIKIEPDGAERVFALTTDSGNYVAWGYASKNCAAAPGQYGWEDHGSSNEQELAERLRVVSYRKTRAEVANYLPKSDRKVIVCQLPTTDLKKYRALESAYATQIKGAVSEADPTPQDRQALQQLALATVAGKIPTALERAYDHCSRGAKVLLFSNFHETLEAAWDAFEDAKQRDNLLAPHFCAGGWMTPDKRRKVIETWKQTPGSAILLANTLSSGVGIDLADAEVAIFLELAWVPADFVQAEARIQDIHLGKRTTPPLYEYLIVKDTIDESMAGALLQKVRHIDGVVGRDAETSGVVDTLRGAGVVGPARLGLPNTDKETLQAMIAGIRSRLFSGVERGQDTKESVAADIRDAFDEDERPEDEDENEI